MIKIKDIFEYTETFAPVSSQADFDNCGLLVGDMEKEVKNVLLSLDVTPEVIEEAKVLKADLIISHHPVIFSPLKALNSGSIPYLLAREDIAALCLHTNLDRARDCGVNICLAKALGLSQIELFPEDFIAVGTPERKLSVFDLAKEVKNALNCESVEYILGEKIIERIAVSSGAGGDGFIRARELGADMLVTGEVKHHQLLEAHALGVPIIAAGHFHTEDLAIQPLCEKLSQKFPEISFSKSENYRWISHKI